MSQLHEVLARVAALLDDRGQPWALLGGLAVAAYVEPRFTRDIDIAVALAGDPEAEQLVLDLQRLGYRIGMVLEHQAAGRLATVRLLPPGETASGVVIDLMFASSGIEPEICREATILEVIRGLRVPVCRSGHLLALKILARDDVRRPQDLVDIRALLANIGPDEIDLARRGIEVITERGYHRDRDLIASLSELLSEQGGAGGEG